MIIRGGRATLGAGVALLLAVAGTGVIAATGGFTVVTDQASGATEPPALLGSGIDGSDASLSGRVSVSAVVVRLEVVPRRPKSKGPVEVRAIVTNLSATKVPEVVLSVRATPSTLTLRPTDTKVLRSLAAGRSADATWSLCSTEAGTFLVVATATVANVEVESRQISVTLAGARC